MVLVPLMYRRIMKIDAVTFDVSPVWVSGIGNADLDRGLCHMAIIAAARDR